MIFHWQYRRSPGWLSGYFSEYRFFLMCYVNSKRYWPNGSDFRQYQTTFSIGCQSVAHLSWQNWRTLVSAWIGFTRARERERIEAFIRRCKRSELCSAETKTVAEICEVYGNQLFSKITRNPCHILNQLLPPVSAAADKKPSYCWDSQPFVAIFRT